MYTDGSLQGLGAILAQLQDGQKRVMAYASQSLQTTKKNPHKSSSFKLELLARVWAITKKLGEYLMRADKVFTDNFLAYLEMWGFWNRGWQLASLSSNTISARKA